MRTCCTCKGGGLRFETKKPIFVMMHIQDIEQYASPGRMKMRLQLLAIEIDYARDIATLKPQQQFMQQ